MQIHHIDENPSNHDPANLAVLCQECHAKTQMAGAFVRRLGGLEVRKCRDDWIRRIQERRARADELAAVRQSGIMADSLYSQAATDWTPPSDFILHTYIKCVPDILNAAYEAAKHDITSGIGHIETQALYAVTDVVEQIWLHLAAWFPPHRFGGKPANIYFSEFLASRFEWHRALFEYIQGPKAKLARKAAAFATLKDAKDSIEELVHVFAETLSCFSFDEWHDRWVEHR